MNLSPASLATSNPATTTTCEPRSAGANEGAVTRALAAASSDATRIGDLLDVLKSARLWLPLPDDGTPAIRGTAVTLPTVSYLGSDFVPAYSSAELLRQFTAADRTEPPEREIPHAVVRAADLARLLPPSIGIALNAGASQSVPVYPQDVAYLAGDDAGDAARIMVAPVPAGHDSLLADVAAGLARIPQAAEASAAWLTIQFAGDGLVISVALDDPGDASVKEAVIAAVELATAQAMPQSGGFPIDLTFPGESEPDDIDERISACTTPFYRRGSARPG